MKPNFFTRIVKKAKKVVANKAEQIYKAASPKVQKELDKIIATKTEDIVHNALTVGGITMMVIFVARAAFGEGSENESESKDLARTINTYYNRVNITYNYYSKED